MILTLCNQSDTKRSHEEKSLLALVNHLPIKIGEGDRAAEFLRYHFSDIEKATSDFSAENKLGEGGFGPVYKVSYLYNTPNGPLCARASLRANILVAELFLSHIHEIYLQTNSNRSCKDQVELVVISA